MTKIIPLPGEVEAQIELMYSLLLTAKTPEAQRKAFAAMSRLVRSRTPDEVRRLEKEKGLCR